MKNFLTIALTASIITVCDGQQKENKFPLKDTTHLIANNVTTSPSVFNGKKSLQVVDAQTESNSELKLVTIPNSDFRDGVIEVELAGRPMKQASEGARGFVGLHFG